jgi:uncharacterized protein YigA (DUF484 family)
MAAQQEIRIAGIPFAVWVQIVTTIATVVGAFSVIHTEMEIASRHIQELKQDVRELRDRGLQNEKDFGTIPNELKYLDRRLSDLEAPRNRIPR